MQKLFRVGIPIMIVIILLIAGKHLFAVNWSISTVSNDANVVKHSSDDEGDESELLQLELILSHDEYKANTPIDCKAVLSYVGEADYFEFCSGEPLVMFAIAGGEYFKGELDLLNKGQCFWKITKYEPIEVPFRKYKGWHLNTDKEAVLFWESFLVDEELKLEPGEYEIFARCVYASEPGGEYTTITQSKRIIVK